MTGYTTGAYPALHTARGHVRAKTIVLCGEAYLTRLPKLRRQLIPVYSLITLTEPLSSADWAEIGWEGRECIDSCRYTVDYLSKTADGRILFGGRGAPYHFGSSIKDAYDQSRSDPPDAARQRARPGSRCSMNVKFTHTWGGPLGWPRDFMPTMAYDPREVWPAPRGYTGIGVATANLSGRVLADLITGPIPTSRSCPRRTTTRRNWEPEPFRWLGVRYVQRGYWRIDQKAERTGDPPNGKTAGRTVDEALTESTVVRSVGWRFVRCFNWVIRVCGWWRSEWAIQRPQRLGSSSRI